MNNRFVFFTLIISSSLFFSCQNCITGEGDPIEETRTTESFNQLNLESSVDISLIQVTNLTAHKVILSAQENIMPNLNCEVNNHKLDINMTGCTINAKGLNAAVFFSELNKINSEGSGNVSSENPIFAKRLTLDSEGSGDMQFEFNGDMLVINNKGSGDFKITGKCKDLLVNSDGSGNLDLTNLLSERVSIESNGSGNVSVMAIRKAKLELNGSGNISLKGDPQNLEQKRNGSGEIKRIN